MSCKLRVESLKAPADSLKALVKILKCEIKSTSYGFKSMSYEFKFKSSRMMKSIKTQVNNFQFFTGNEKNKKWRYQFCVT